MPRRETVAVSDDPAGALLNVPLTLVLGLGAAVAGLLVAGGG